MKTIPTLRDKRRYIAFEVMSEQRISRDNLFDEVLNSTHSLFGDAGSSEINFSLISFDGRYGIIRCQRIMTMKARASLACVTRINGGRISILVLGISGTIKGATEKFIQVTCIKDAEPE